MSAAVKTVLLQPVDSDNDREPDSELSPRNILKVKSIFTANKRKNTQIFLLCVAGAQHPDIAFACICVYLR